MIFWIAKECLLVEHSTWPTYIKIYRRQAAGSSVSSWFGSPLRRGWSDFRRDKRGGVMTMNVTRKTRVFGIVVLAVFTAPGLLPKTLPRETSPGADRAPPLPGATDPHLSLGP